MGKELNLVNFSPRDPGSRLLLNRSLANSYGSRVSRADDYDYKVSQRESSPVSIVVTKFIGLALPPIQQSVFFFRSFQYDELFI